MNIRTSCMLAAVLAVTGAVAAVPAYALNEPCPGCGSDPMVTAQQALADNIPITVSTDAETYDHNSVIMVKGTVANVKPGIPITVKVVSPINNIVAIQQLDLAADGTYSTTLSTAGDLWKYDGTYTIRVQYGSHDVNNKALVRLTDGAMPSVQPVTPTMDCTGDQIPVAGQCIPYSITGGTVTGVDLNPGTSIVVNIRSTDDGMITLSPPPSAFRNLELAFVDGEQWDDVSVDGNSIMIRFPAGAETVEILGSFVIPEFGAVAALVLAAAIVSIVAVTARSRLSIMPRY